MKLMGSWAQPAAETYQSEKSKQLIESRKKKKEKKINIADLRLMHYRSVCMKTNEF